MAYRSDGGGWGKRGLIKIESLIVRLTLDLGGGIHDDFN